MEIKAFSDGKETIESLQERITGRYIAAVSYTHLDVYKRQIMECALLWHHGHFTPKNAVKMIRKQG